MRARKQIEEYDATRDCPTFDPAGRRGGRRTIHRRCGAAFATLLDTIDTPAEFTAAVLVESYLEPNSATRWTGSGAYGTAPPSCRQVFFFDTRRPLRALIRLIGDCQMVNHAAGAMHLMRFEQSVGVRDAHLCQCGKLGCPGTGYRYRVLQQRVGGAHVVCPDAVSHTTCCAASRYYDQLSEQLVAADACESEPSAALDHWLVVDKHTGLPLLPEEYDVTPLAAEDFETEEDYCDALLERYSKSHDEHTSKRTAQIVYEPLRFDLDAGAQAAGSPLHVRVINADAAVRSYRTATTHCAPLCAQRIGRMADRAGARYAEMQDVLRSAKHKSGGGAGDDPESAEASDEDPCAAFETLSCTVGALVDETLDAVGRRHEHPTDCSCLIERYLNRHCERQIEIDLVPLPTNPLYPNMGDTIFDIGSPLMRELGVKQAVCALLNAKRLDANPIERDAERGTQHHFETVLVRNVPLRKMLAAQFGDFRFSFNAERRCFDFCALDSQRAEQRFARQKERPNARQHRADAVHGRVYDAEADSYESLISRARRLIGNRLRAAGGADAALLERVATAPTLTELALHNGALRDPELATNCAAWLTPAVAICLHQAAGSASQLETHARAVLNAEHSERAVLGRVCERSIVNELHRTTNRRVVMARIGVCLLCSASTMRQFRDAVLFVTSAFALVRLADSLPQLEADERQRAESAERARMDRERAEKRRAMLAEQRELARQRKAVARERKRQEAERRSRREAERRAREECERRAREERERRAREERERKRRDAERKRQEAERKRQEAERREAKRKRQEAERRDAERKERERLAAMRQPSLVDFLRTEAQIDFFQFSTLSVQ